jgi:pimeloyl-ACP methyl ester carboxylesterase
MNWLLLRGLGREKKYWFDFPEKLEALGHKTLSLNLPGLGDEVSTKPPLSIAGHTDFLRERFLERRDTDQNWGLLGISLGGMIAMDWAARYPDDFGKLVVINSSGRDLSPMMQRISVFAMYCVGRAAVAKNEESREATILKMVSNLKADDPKTLHDMVKTADLYRTTRAILSKQIAAAAKFSTPAAIKVPTLVLASIKDHMVDVRCSKAIADKYSAQIKFHPTAGHDLTLDDPQWAAERVNEFVS